MLLESTYDRRRFLSATAMTLAAPGFALLDFSSGNSRKSDLTGTTQTSQMSNNSFKTIKQINAGVLNIGYAETGPENGTTVILLHGWPYDICSFKDVAPLLSSAGYRVIVPYLRGFGTTQFLSD